jgi:predicted aspartyl protease
METGTMGRVLTEATIESLQDLWAARRGTISADQVRGVTVPDALVDTRVTPLSLPTRVIKQLGLNERPKRRLRGSADAFEASIYDPVRLTIQGRDCTMDVVEVPDGTPVLIGHIVLTRLDLVIDPQSDSLIGNPAHGGEEILEL